MTAAMGTIRGEIRINAKQALAAYASVQRANASTKAALLGASATFAKVGAGALLAAAPIALLFKNAVTGAAEFQKKIDYFGAVTNASKKDMADVAQAAMDMSRDTVYSAQDMADAFVEFGKAGISTKDILNGVASATINLAQAADISVAEASNTMAAQLATFHLGAGDAAHIADELAGAANASIIDVQDLAYSLKYAGGIAAATHIPFDSLITAISLLGKAGIRGSTAGTSLRQIMVSIAGPTDAASTALESLGIVTADGSSKFIDAAGHIKPLAKVFQILQNATRGYTDAQRLAVTKTIFNSRALAAVQILMHEGTKGFAKMNEAIGKVKAADVARKRLDNLAGDWKKLTNNIKTTLIQVGGPLQNFFRGIVQGLTGLVKWFGNLSPAWQKAIIYGLGIVGMFLALTGVVALTISLVLKVIAVWRDFMAAMRLLRSAMVSLRIMMMMLGDTMAMNPALIWIAALVAIGVAIFILWKKCKWFRDAVKAVWHAIQAVAVWLWHSLKAIFSKIGEVFSSIGHAFMKIYHAIAGVISTIIDFVKKHWKAIIAVVLGPIGLLIDAITTHWNWIKQTTIKIWNLIYGFVKWIWVTTFQVAKTIWNAVYNFFKMILSAIYKFFKFQFEAIKTIITKVFIPIYHFIKNIVEKIYGITKKVLGFIYNVYKKVFTAIWNFIKPALQRIWNFFVSIFSHVWDGISAAAGFIGRIGQKIWDIISSAFQGVAKWLYNIGRALVNGLWEGIKSLAGWLWDQVSGWIKGIWHGITSFFGIGSPSKQMAWAGEMMVQGLAKGILDNHHHAVKAAETMSKAVMEAGTTNLGTHYSHTGHAMSAARQAAYVNVRGRGGDSKAGINIENLNVKAAPNEKLTTSIPRSIRKASFLVGPPR